MTFKPVNTGDKKIDAAIYDIYKHLNTINDSLAYSKKDLLLLKNVIGSEKVLVTEDGGLAVKRINKTGGLTVKGEVVTASSTADRAVEKIVINVPNPVGVFLDNGIPDGEYAWVVFTGIAKVYFVGNTTRGHIGRGFVTGEADYVIGRAKSEAIPTSPFATDKHFYEICHINESRTGEGLAEAFLHFN